MKKLELWVFLVFVFGAILLLPDIVLAEPNFDKLLTDGKLVVHSIKPTDDEMASIILYEFTPSMQKYPNYDIDWENPCNEDYTKCTIYYRDSDPNNVDPSKEVEMSYVYDKDVKTTVDSIINKLDSKNTFSLNDIELITYLMSEKFSMVNYSNELKKTIGYKNININSLLGPDCSTFYTENYNEGYITYDDTLYYRYIKSNQLASAEHIIYVDDHTTDVLAAVKTRLTKVFGTDFEVEETGTVEEFLNHEKERFKNEYQQENSQQQPNDAEAEAYAEAEMNKYYRNIDSKAHFVYEKKAEKYYTLTINDAYYNFLVVKDSSKINNNVNLVTNDVKSGITISTSSPNIPLDTVIKVKKLTNGPDYEKIIKTLKVKNSETYDLSLYSSLKNKNITEGTFEVKIPISDAFKGKSLIVYYVDKNNKVEEHDVTVKDGYAIFTTNHFSIYTLTEKPTEKTSSTTDSTTPVSPVEHKKINPQTSDNVLTYVGMLFVSALGVISLSFIYLKNKKKIRNN